MKIGKIKVKIESIGGKRFFFARPIANRRQNFPSVIGICHVVYVEKNEISRSFQLNEEYEFFALFYKSISNEDFNSSYCNIKVTPISDEAYEVLHGKIETDIDFNHAFN